MDVRMQEHPILGAMGLSKKVKFQYNGTELEGYEDEPIAMALKAASCIMQIRRKAAFDLEFNQAE